MSELYYKMKGGEKSPPFSKEKMEKSTFEFHPNKNVRIDFQGHDIVIDPNISIATKKVLTTDYIETFFDENDQDVVSRFVKAEYVIMLGIIDVNTNVDISNIGVDLIISSGLWNIVKQNIKNYDAFYADLMYLVSYVREQKALEQSVGQSLDRIMDDVNALIDKLLNVDFSKEGIADLLKTLNVEKDNINEIVDPSKTKKRGRPKAS